MKRYLWCTALLLLAPTAAESQILPDEESIQGTWLLSAMETDGETDTTNKNVGNVSLVFGSNGHYAVRPTGFEFPGMYALDSSKTPKTLDITVGNRTVLAIYELTGDTLRICEGGGRERPQIFRSSTCSEGAIVVYRRVMVRRHAR